MPYPAATSAGLIDFPAIETAEAFHFMRINLTADSYLPNNAQENLEYVGSEPESAYHQILHGYMGRMLGHGKTFRIGPSGENPSSPVLFIQIYCI
jgi:hypothetical protein